MTNLGPLQGNISYKILKIHDREFQINLIFKYLGNFQSNTLNLIYLDHIISMKIFFTAFEKKNIGRSAGVTACD